MPVDLMLVAASVVMMFVVFAAASRLGRFADPSEAIGAAVQRQAPGVLIRAFPRQDVCSAQESTAVNDIVRRYARSQVPRYTSYPTAAEFTTAVASADQRRWLRDLDTTEAVSVYLHVPYCRELCLYCGCNTKKALRDDVIASYRVALEREIELVSDALSGPVRIARLHWGGGTPSILGAEGLASVMQVLRRHFVFEAGFEHAIELDPRYVTPLLAASLKELGVNRASLGVQDVNPLVQAAIGRWQPMRDVEAAVLRLRAAGIGNLNFDLIYGLPLQTIASLRKTCEIVAMLSPDRIACYGYAHMPRLKANQRRIDESTLPGVEERIDQAEAIAEEFQRTAFSRSASIILRGRTTRWRGPRCRDGCIAISRAIPTTAGRL